MFGFLMSLMKIEGERKGIICSDTGLSLILEARNNSMEGVSERR
jgi:hypothetical protein